MSSNGADRRQQGLYSIGVISRMLGLHQQTLRMYEKRGLIRPRRTAGNTSLFSESDVERIRRIQRLTVDFGVNLAGVEMIMEMRERIEALQRERKVLEQAVRELVGVLMQYQERGGHSALIRAPLSNLIRLLGREEESASSAI